ncbi:MAG: hypothetical protein ACE5HA_05100 [Anaerolineae bacterium]
MNRNTTATLRLALLACAILVGLAWAGALAVAAGETDASPVTIDVDLPSDSTGTPGGTLALRIFAPESAGDARYPEGAPVVVYVPGGTDAGTLRPALQQASDVIRIVFLFPGGSDRRTGRRSDGAYDYRGPDSIAALRDVILYAAGELTDAAGHTIDDVVPMPILHDNIGLLGASNGGNIVVAVAAEHGAVLAGHLRYIVQWESPVSSQIATVDLGRVNLDCPPGKRESLSAVNPRYLSYGPLTLDVDYSQLVYDAGDPLHRVFFDGTGDGHYTTVLDPRNGCQTPDLNLNGTLELNEDFPLSTFTDGVKQLYSRPVTEALADQNVFGGSWPADVATPPQAEAFWDLREAVRQYAAALTNIPDLEGMVLTSVVDHVQTAPDHPHIRQAFDGWLSEALSPTPQAPLPLSRIRERGRGVAFRPGGGGEAPWVKINPARAYALEVDPSLSSRTDLPDNAANTAPAYWIDATSYAFPDGLEETYFAAAVHEMADRAHAASATPTPTNTATITPTPTSTPTSTPSATTSPTPTATTMPPASQCVGDVNGNGVGDVVDIQAAASDLPCHVYLPLIAAQWRRPWPTETPTATATVTPTATATPTATSTSTPESWVYEETVFYSDENLSRPELCFVGNRAYLVLRKIVTPEGGGPKDRLIVLKVFDVDPAGDWTDRTADLFPDDPHVLYGPGDPNPAGDFTDHQLICSDDAFFVVFEAHYKQAGQDLKRTVVRRYLPDWTLDRQAFLFDGAVGLTEYKMDDPGAALLNGTLFVWVVKLSQSPMQATGFALYGVDPGTLDVVVDDGAGNPVSLANPEHAPFAGVVDFIDGEYHLLSSPHAVGEAPFTQDGLVDYRYDQDWNLLGYEVADDPFGDDQPTYTTGRIRYDGQEAWGFTLQPEGRSQDGGAIGQAWVRLAGAGGGATYFLVSDNDATPEDDDTRHTELAIHNGKAYVAYFHILEGTDRATTIKRYRIPTSDQSPPLYFLYAIHTHVQGDWFPYTDLGMTEIDTQVADNMIAAIDGIAQVLESHGAKGSWEVVYGTSKGLCTYQGDDHVFQQLVDSGHEVGVHAHRTVHIEPAFQNLEDYCGITADLTSGFMIEAADAGAEGAQETLSQAIEEALGLGMTVGTENLSPADPKNPFGELCDDQIGVGNDMWEQSGNLMFPWRPDYTNRNICADDPEGDMVFVDHVPPGWMILPDQGKVDVLSDANFDQLREQFDAALAYMEENQPDRVAAWGFVSHINEYAVGSRGENPPDATALAALDRFLEYVDSKVAEGRVVYATAGEIADLAFPSPTPSPTPALNRPEDSQIGLNFIRFFWAPPGEPDTTTPYVQPEWIFNDFAELGIHTFRQFIWADLLWDIVEPQDDEWNFEQADAVITNPDFEPIVTLFRLQYASATPPWAADPSEFQKTLGPEARDYLETIIERYGPYVKYWEIGNEMDHWRAADPDAVNPHPPNLPPSYPLAGFSPQEQGVFLAQVAAFIRERDPDAVIIMSGMGGLDEYTLNAWFAGVIEGGGTDWFDVVNYHYYPGWQAYGRRRQDLQTFLEVHDIAGKPVWLTETGSTASPTLTIRTDYPNSPESQAADVFRRLIQAYGYGDSLAMWHTYIGSPDTPGNMWRLYGIRTDTAEAQPAYHSLKLLVEELIPFESVEILSSVPAGENSFRITTEVGDVKYVVWGSGSFTVPAGITQMTSVIPNADGGFTWQPVEAGDVITLAPEPVLLK